MKRLSTILLATAMVAGACSSSGGADGALSPAVSSAEVSTTTLEVAPESGPALADDNRLEVMLLWHQHQPLYPLDSSGVVTRPWVRLHAAKDYVDMANLAASYPDLHVTFNLTPVLLLQLEALANGTVDTYQVHTEVPAADLTVEQRQFVFDRFFDINPKVIARFPRFKELSNLRPEGVDAFDDRDITDLQVLFNLGWTDPDELAKEPLAALVAKGHDFVEADKATVLAEHLRLVKEVAPAYKAAWDTGRIEIATTPLAHPILPLLADTNLALEGDPTATLPEARFRHIPDATEQVRRGLDVAERILSRRPQGMWPGEGSVAQMVLPLFSREGVRWVATGEDVLARTLDIGSFNRGVGDLVEEASSLYRPWSATFNRNPDLPVFFRDTRLSDQIGFQYSGMSAQAAADDFMARLDAIDQATADMTGPRVVSVILDGENAWENYPNDGKDFLNALYTALTTSDRVRTVTPSEVLDAFGDQIETVGPVAAGSWIDGNFGTWIGEKEEAAAWDYLTRARDDLAAAEVRVAPDVYEAAFDKMLFAEGSDWFWWYGADQNSGNDDYFDSAYRELLGQMYDELGDRRPDWLDIPIIPAAPVLATVSPNDLFSVSVDGTVGDGEWVDGGRFDVGATALRYGFDRENLYLALPNGSEATKVWVGAPTGSGVPRSTGGDLLGFGATHVIDLAEGCVGATSSSECAPMSASGREIAVPLSALGPLDFGDRLLLAVESPSGLFPGSGPAQISVPDVSNVEIIASFTDPVGDDYGPGSYVYPFDDVFTAGSFDFEGFTIGLTDSDVVFTFDVVAPIRNPWSSAGGLSIQTFDVYADTDPGAGTGTPMMLDGRNAALEDGNGWDFALTVEGWESAVFDASADGTVVESAPTFDMIVVPDRGQLTVRIPRELLPAGDPSAWGWAVALLSQEGFPAGGVRRVRDVLANPEQWRLGGAPGGSITHTRIMDLLNPEAGVQETSLSDVPSATPAGEQITAKDVARVPLVFG